MMSLNAPQEKAVQCTEGPLLILAGAGSGKTYTVIHRIAALLQQGVAPHAILGVTFTNKAAKEMRERIAALVGKDQADPIWMMTFHSMCARILRTESVYTNKIGKNFSIYDPKDTQKVMQDIIKENNWDPKLVPKQNLAYYISALKNEMVDVASFLQKKPSNPYIDWKKASELIQQKIPDTMEHKVSIAYEAYQKALLKNNAVDFDDLILETIHLFIDNPDLLEKYQNKFRYIMVDEYQDTNHAQYVLVKLLAQKHRNLCVVGDDSQAIYKFRGADIRNILEFEKDYPDAVVIKLEENYRSTPHILRAANEVIAKNTLQRKKELFTTKQTGEKIGYYAAMSETDEARYVTNEILSRMRKENRQYKDFAILFRTNSQSRAFEESFMRSSIPYQLIGGLKFWDRQEIKDIIAYLQFIYNPQDTVSLSRIINVPKRSIGDKTLDALLREAMPDTTPSVEQLSFLDPSVLTPESPESNIEPATEVQAAPRSILDIMKQPDGIKLSSKAKEELFALATFVEKMRELSQVVGVGDLIPEIVKSSGYLLMLSKSKDEKSQERLENISELYNIARLMQEESDDPSLASFLEHASLNSAIDGETEDQAVRLMTVHAAKGLEFPVVFLVGLEEGIFPHKRSSGAENLDIEEERRLCYVGFTRAKDKLFLTRARNRTTWGKEESHDPSRFLTEFSEELIDPKYPLLRR